MLIGVPAILSAQQTITSGTYAQDFNSLSAGLPSGWSVRTLANASSLGNTATLNTATTTAWAATTGQFANFASNNIPSSSDAATQTADFDRALGVRQTGSFGDPGAAFTFNFSTINVDLQSISFDMMTLSNQPRFTTWTIQYGIGVTPSTFADLGTYVSGTGDDPKFASTNYVFDLASFSADLAAMSNQASVWFRVVALTASGSSSNRDTTAIDNFSIAAIEASGGSELYWSAGSWNSTSPGTGGGGSWNDGAGGWDASSKAVFSGASGGSVTVGTVTADAGVQFSTSGYTLSGGTLTLGSAVVEVDSGISAAINSTIAGSSGLTLVGGGTLALGGANTFTGAVTISNSTLAISSDDNLGNTDNDVVLSGGMLDVAGSISLGTGRDVSGVGSIRVSTGNALSITGVVNAGLTLAGSGTVVLNSASDTLTALGFSAPGTLVIAGGNTANLTGEVSTSHTAGTALVSGNLNLGSALRAFTVADGSADVDLEVNGNLSGASAGRLHKLGAGTLRLVGDNSALAGGVRLGTANGPTGGRLIVTNNTSLGTGVLQLNHGTLFAENNADFNVAVSIGGIASAPAVIEGANTSFTGTNSFFTSSGQRNVLKINNTTTFSGSFTYSTANGGTGLNVGGTGTLIVDADASGFMGATSVQDTLKLTVNNTWASDITVESNAAFSGIGNVLGTLTIAGDLAPGNGTAGILTAGNLTLESTAVTTMSLLGGGVRGTDYSAMNVTGLLSYGGSLVLSLAAGDYSLPADLFDFAGMSGALSAVDLIGAYGSVTLLDGDLDGVWEATVAGTTFNFSTSSGIFTVVPVPEPSTYALLLAGAGLVFWTLRRKRQNA